MRVVHVHVQVRPDRPEAFKAATLANARASVREPGIARFDVIQGLEDPSRFVLVEVCRSQEDPGRHKRTAHYAARAEAVATMMVEGRSSVKYENLFPENAGW